MDFTSYTDEQAQVIRHPAGHAKVSAGPGSGKTHTLVGRVRYLLEQGIDPRRVLVLMFNKSARDNFEARLKRATRHGALLPEIRTYHSFGHTLCERLAKARKMRHAKLLAEEWRIKKYARDVFMAAGKDAGVPNDVIYNPDNFENFLAYVDACKACLDPFEVTFASLRLSADCRFFVEALRRFEDLRVQERFRTYADLLYDPAICMLNDASAVALCQDRFESITVDEFQDTSPVQMALLRWTAGKRAEVMVIGDPDQCIYEWRSARPEIMLREFDVAFPNTTTYALTRTFRFGHRLALAANQVITSNKQRDDRLCVSDAGAPDTRVEMMPDTVSAAELTRGWQSNGGALRDIAVLVRTYAMASLIELDLLENKVPYRLEGGESVVHSKVTEAVLGWAMVSLDGLSNLNRVSLKPVLSALLAFPPLGLTKTQVEVLIAEMVTTPSMIPDILRQAAIEARPAAATACRLRASLWSRLAYRRKGDEMAAPLLEMVFLETGAEEYFMRSGTVDNAADKIALMEGLVQFCRRRGLTVRGFVDLFNELRGRSALTDDDAILITSLHRAKGLEFPMTILPGLREGSFPPKVVGRNVLSLNFEDERRLFFVGLTRATHRCVLLHPDDDELLASGERGRLKASGRGAASRFLYEAGVPLANRCIDAIASAPSQPIEVEDAVIANRYLETVGSSLRLVGKQAAPGRASPFQDPTQRGAPAGYSFLGVDLQVGQQVVHPTFGMGRISGFEQDGQIAVVGFGPSFQFEKWLRPEAAIQAGMKPV